MVRDLDGSIEAMAEHDLIAALAGDPLAQEALRQAGMSSEIPSPDFTPPSDEFLVLDADSSQNYAINAVLAGRSLIIKGPPGTGKSQTISNLVSTLVARGKRVLFVAEKRAAIDAVLRRLTDVGLDDLVLDLHGGVSSRRQTAQAVATALNNNARLAKPELGPVHRQLEQRRSQLTERVEAVHSQSARRSTEGHRQGPRWAPKTRHGKRSVSPCPIRSSSGCVGSWLGSRISRQMRSSSPHIEGRR